MINELKETHNQNVDQQNGFHHLLDEMNIPYVEDNVYLNVGEIPEVDGWVLFLTANIDQIPDLISVACPILSKENVSYSVIKEKKIASMKNDFWYGPDEVGKMIIVFTVEEATTKRIINEIRVLTSEFLGPSVNYSIRLGEIIYVGYIRYVHHQEEDGSISKVSNMVLLNPKKLPFKVDRKYQYWKKKRLLKRRYVPLLMLGRSPKGDLLKSVDLKWLGFNWCFIKEGKYQAFDDKYGRYIRDRLLWQAKALQELWGRIPIPKFIDYFEQDEDSYLVMEFLEGVDLYRKIEELYQKKTWADLSEVSHRQLIGYYLEVLCIIEKMHEVGYVHRDATASNFMITKSGEVYAIDLELSYCLYRNEPDPPFAMGVFGYVPPEQIIIQTPTVKEDVYTVGALLLHVLTGNHPSRYIDRDSSVNKEQISKDVLIVPLLEVMLRCFDINPDGRPELAEIKKAVEDSF